MHYLGPLEQRALNYTCSDIIGWNSLGRRNIALLEALKWGADVIVTIDDDNIPLDQNYFSNIHNLLWHAHLQLGADIKTYGTLFNGIEASSLTGWFDVGQLLDPPAKHRGFPYDVAQNHQHFSPVVDARVGVAAGICLGDPDIDAVTRMAVHPTVHRVSELLRAGVVTDPQKTRTVFNTQNTAFVRELAPCFLMHNLGRYDDIFASLIAQRVMREHGYYVHFGQPFVWQQRNQHDLLKDLDKEVWGMNNIMRFVHFLEDVQLPPAGSVATQLYHLYQAAAGETWLNEMWRLGKAWLQDIDLVM